MSGVRVAVHHQHLLLSSVSMLTLYLGKEISSVWSAVWKAVCLVLKQIWPDLHWMRCTAHCWLHWLYLPLTGNVDTSIRDSLWSLNWVPSGQALGHSCKKMVTLWPRGSYESLFSYHFSFILSFNRLLWPWYHLPGLLNSVSLSFISYSESK